MALRQDFDPKKDGTFPDVTFSEFIKIAKLRPELLFLKTGEKSPKKL
jgi:hypothetical protein